MKMSETGLELLKEFEGLRLKAYRDAAGIWTIGYGTTSAAGVGIIKGGMLISKAEAENMLRRSLASYERAVSNSIKVEISQQQFDALVSFAYNVGIEGFRRSSVLRHVNARDFDRVPQSLSLWIKSKGKVLPGLVSRRAREAKLFVKGDIA
jgi:lysozyme